MSHLSVHRLSKTFRRYPTPWSRLLEWAGLGQRHEKIAILKDLNFSVGVGEAVGIIGRNGAGKSTLLKIITGSMQPSNGGVERRGQIAALLELGMGFNPDMTGRQNVQTAGLIAGLSKAELEYHIPAIEAFAGIGRYIDRPVREYSSGMQVRLAFSMATAIRREIIIIDEALAVGDAYFQHKCFERLKAYKAAGSTLLFVSHDPGAIKNLCERAILLEKGSIYFDGPPDEAFDIYNALIAPEEARSGIQFDNKHVRSGDGRARVERVALESQGRQTDIVACNDPVDLVLEVAVKESLDSLTAGFTIKDRLGNEIFGTNSHYLQAEEPSKAAGSHEEIRFHFAKFSLGAGSYSISVALHSRENHLGNSYDWWDKAMVFEVTRPPSMPGFVGCSFIPVTIGIRPTQVTQEGCKHE